MATLKLLFRASVRCPIAMPKTPAGMWYSNRDPVPQAALRFQCYTISAENFEMNPNTTYPDI
jgi:hypothetical protein